MTSFLALDRFFRAGSFFLLLQAAVIFARGSRRPAARLGIALVLDAAVQALVGSQTVFPGPVILLLAVNAALLVPLFWLFARAWFDDAFTLRWGDGAILALFALAGGALYGLGTETGSSRLLDLAVKAAGTALALHTLWLTWRGRNADLVEHRRQIRGLFVALIGLLIVWSIWSETRLSHGAPLPLIITINEAILAAIVLLLGSTLFGLRHADIFPAPRAAPAPDRPSTADTQDNGFDPVLAGRLAGLMQHERLYRDPELSLARLAVRLDLPDYRLRRLINGGLGYRNFNEYLNGLRLNEVRAALADPGQSDTSILTIALDAGFGSLPAFNRAFKGAYGETPRDFRRQAMRAD